MYTLKIKGKDFTIPKANLRMLAMTKAMDLGRTPHFPDDISAISFLNELGIEVTE